MVGVTVTKSAKDVAAELSDARGPLLENILREREENARTSHRHDYSHVFRSKTRFELFRLSAIAMAIEFAYAAETSFVSPILLQIGIDHKHMTLAWGLSPLIGFFMSPLLGSLSDRCRLSWGRRRPVISLLSLGILAGLILVPWGKQLGALLGDDATGRAHRNNSTASFLDTRMADAEPPASTSFPYAIVFTVVGMVLLDFDADTCQTPARTYMLDMCTAEDQQRALTTFTLFAGIGGTIGYALGAIDWTTTRIGGVFGGNIPTVFALVTVIFIVCYLVTVMTFREIPLKLLEEDELLRPVTAEVVERELRKNNNAVYYIKEATAELLAASHLPPLVVANATNVGIAAEPRTQNDTAAPSEKPLGNGEAGNVPDYVDRPVSLAHYLKSTLVMPHSMRMLALTNLFCWMGHVTYCLYFTDFVGEAVFHGNPSAPPGSEEAELYEAGIRFGCWGMSIYALSCSIYSLVVGQLMTLLGTRTVYISGILYYGVSMLVLGLWPTKWGVLLFSTSAGILYGTLFTLPYILVANYHSKNCFRVRNGETVPLQQPRGLGTDVAIISSCVFAAQLIVSLFMGPLVAWMGTTCAVLYASTLLAFFAAIAAIFVLYI